MRKCLIVLLCLISFSSFAQKKTKWNTAKFDPDNEHENFFRFGAKAGLNMNKLQGQPYKKGFRYNFQAGAFLQFNFSPLLGIQPEVNFVQASSELTSDSEDIADDLFGGGSQNKAKLNYLEIPVLLNVNLGPSKRVKIQAGPSYGVLLKQKVDSLKPNTSIYKKQEWSVMGGLWLQLPVLHLGARYKLGLSDINATGSNETWKNQAIQVFIGLTF